MLAILCEEIEGNIDVIRSKQTNSVTNASRKLIQNRKKNTKNKANIAWMWQHISRLNEDAQFELDTSRRLHSTDIKKNSVLLVIPDLQTRKHRRDVLLLFNDDVGAAIKQATKANNDDEAIILYKATQIVHFLKEELYMESKTTSCLPDKQAFDAKHDINQIPPVVWHFVYKESATDNEDKEFIEKLHRAAGAEREKDSTLDWTGTDKSDHLLTPEAELIPEGACPGSDSPHLYSMILLALPHQEKYKVRVKMRDEDKLWAILDQTKM
ncbi:unnamed protein product [Mytilus edulis]|uniref:Uncharacterized protein n=1 Tax=Mytilus edulis TaxID=6550 RepID=A0A8S3U5E1_MYTED|nr:unnamed protein product [Mytilus edulis]